MQTRLAPSIVDVDRLQNGILIVFADGKVILYSHDLLRSMLPQALDVTHLEHD